MRFCFLQNVCVCMCLCVWLFLQDEVSELIKSRWLTEKNCLSAAKALLPQHTAAVRVLAPLYTHANPLTNSYTHFPTHTLPRPKHRLLLPHTHTFSFSHFVLVILNNIFFFSTFPSPMFTPSDAAPRGCPV